MFKQAVLALFLSGAEAMTPPPKATALPTVIFHGFGDQCSNPGMTDFTKEIGQQTGAYAECIEIGDGASSSIFENFEK